MKKIVITAESGSDITAEDRERYGIEIIPMHVTMGDVSLDDGAFPPEDVCRYYDENKVLPKTSGCSPDDFTRFFERVNEKYPGAHIFHMAYSAETTVSYNSALIASEDREDITVIDTKHVSVGQRAAVLAAARLLEENPDMEIEELKQAAEKLCERTRMCFVPADLVYLHAGGRCSNLVFVGGQLLKLHPCIEVLDGKLVAGKKYRGSFRKIIPSLVKSYGEKYNLDKSHIWFIWSPGLSDEMKAIADEAARECGYKEITWVKTGCVITTHGGPGAFGVVGMSAEEK